MKKLLVSTRLVFSILFTTAFGAVLSSPAGGAVLARGGESMAAIIVRRDACRQTVAAADDLARYIGKITGASPEVVNDRDEAGTPSAVWVGHHEELSYLFPDVDMELRGWEEIVIACRGDNLLIMGRDEAPGDTIQQAGTSLAVYEFIERYLGVRWLWPGELGEDIPNAPSVEFPDFVYRHKPPLRQRIFRMGNRSRLLDAYRGPLDRDDVRRISADLDRAEMEWARRQRGTQPYFWLMSAGHAFTGWYEKYGNEHPDYFALQPDGTRAPFPGIDHGSWAKMCVSNPAVAEQWLDLAESRFRSSPHAVVASASPNDGAYSGVCVCAVCRSWDVWGGPVYTYRYADGDEEYTAITDRQVQFWNVLARGLRERVPERETYVASWAYGPYRTPPVKRQLEENVMVGFVGPMPGGSEARREEDRRSWVGWAQKTKHLFWRPNLFHLHWGTPALFAQRAEEDFRFMVDRGLRGIDVDSFLGHWSNQGLQYYILAKLSWDPSLDVEELKRDYAERAFGEGSAAHMVRYFDVVEKKYYELRETLQGKDLYESVILYPEAYDEKFLAELGELLGNAYQAASSLQYKERLDFIAAGLEFIEAQMSAIEAMHALTRGRGDIAGLVRSAVRATEHRDEILTEQLGCFSLNTLHLLDRTALTMQHNMAPYLGPVGDEYRFFMEEKEDFILLPVRWSFKADPEDIGRRNKWFHPDNFKSAEWGTMLVTSPWGQQMLSDDPYDPGTVEYHGTGWYATLFSLEEKPGEGESLWLKFGSVDESCRVYVNGVLIGEQVFDGQVDADAWRKPRRFEISDYVAEGVNFLAVEVQALAGQGGITRPVYLRIKGENMVRDGYFAGGWNEWNYTIHGENYDNLEERIHLSAPVSRYVEERSLRILIREGPEKKGGRSYFSLGQAVDRNLQSGRTYRVRARVMQIPETEYLLQKISPVSVRLQGNCSGEGEVLLQLSSCLENRGDWEELSGMFTAPHDCEGFSLLLSFLFPGEYVLDEIAVVRACP